MANLRLSLIWHMHQPFYLDPVEGSFSLPWVRLHSLKDYLDMPLYAAAHSENVVNFNLVPSLLEQWEAWELGARDRIQQLCHRPVAGLSAEERAELAALLFRAHPETMIRPRAEYADLHRRWKQGGADSLRDEDLTRLKYWFHLAWLDPLFRSESIPTLFLAEPERMTEESWGKFSEYCDSFPRRLRDTYGRLHREGRIEVSCTPFYHPILPLLIDQETARESMPGVELPRERIAFPEDARWQLRSAKDAFREQLGVDAVGVWPSEGSVSEAALEMISQEGFSWTASDEQVLANSLGLPSLQLPGEERAARLYRPYTRSYGDAELSLVFRDHFLSDRIGFSYATWDPEAAVDDFIANLERIRREAPQAEPLVSVILDGENCWEYYPDDGRAFLELFYERLAETDWIDLGSVSRHVGELETTPLQNVRAGSWIDGNFAIWIGHGDDRRSYEQLALARAELVESSGGLHPLDGDGLTSELQRAWRALFAAEGSDWNWWYGDDHGSDDDDEFDRLYRSHLRAIYEACGKDVPKEVHEPIPAARGRRGGLVPLGLSKITLDGIETNFFEWRNAARFSTQGTGGAMTQVDRLLTELSLAFGEKALFLRLDLDPESGGYGQLERLSIEFSGPCQRIFRCALSGDGRIDAEEFDGKTWRGFPSEARLANGEICEIAIPWIEIPARAGQELQFTLTLLGEAGILEVNPAGFPFVFSMPDPDYDRIMWQV